MTLSAWRRSQGHAQSIMVCRAYLTPATFPHREAHYSSGVLKTDRCGLQRNISARCRLGERPTQSSVTFHLSRLPLICPGETLPFFSESSTRGSVIPGRKHVVYRRWPAVCERELQGYRVIGFRR